MNLEVEACIWFCRTKTRPLLVQFVFSLITLMISTTLPTSPYHQNIHLQPLPFDYCITSSIQLLHPRAHFSICRISNLITVQQYCPHLYDCNRLSGCAYRPGSPSEDSSMLTIVQVIDLLRSLLLPLISIPLVTEASILNHTQT